MHPKSLSQEIPISCFLSDSEFLTKHGDIGSVLLASPRDVECSEQSEINEMAERLTRTWRILGPEYRLYQYWMRRKSELGLYENQMYVALVRINSDWDDKPSLFPRKSVADIKRGLAERRASLSQKIKSWMEQTADFWPQRLASKQEAFSLFWRLFNYDSTKVPPVLGSAGINKQLAESEIDWSKKRIGKRYISTLSLGYLPDDKQTTPFMLEPLLALEADFNLCIQSQGIPILHQKKTLKSAKRTQSEEEKGLGGMLKEGQNGAPIEDRNLNQEALANSEALAKAQREMAEGNRLCQFVMNIMVHAETPEILERSTESVKSAMDLSVRMLREGISQKIVFFSLCPGAHDLAHFRKKDISEASLADFSCVWGTDSGSPWSTHLQAPAVTVFETEQHTPYHWNWHRGDTGHLAIFGKTGTGKSVLLNKTIDSSQKYGGYTSITDLGGSFEFLTKLYGGSYSRIVAGSSNKIGWNPLGWPNSDEQRRFVVSLVTMLVEMRGRSLDDDQVEDINQAVIRFYDSGKPWVLRYLVTFLPEELQRPMRRWHSGGLDSWLLDNDVEDCRIGSSFNTDEWIGFVHEDYEHLLEPMFMCKFRYDLGRLTDPAKLSQFKLIVFDEAWACVKSKRSAAFIRWALKMLRRYNAAVVLSTQSEKDLSETALMPVINECCDKIFLACPGMDPEAYARTFGLREKQLKTVQGLVPKRQLFVSNAGMSGKVLNNNLTEAELLRYATDATTVTRRNDALETHGEKWLESLLGPRSNGHSQGSGNGANGKHEKDANSISLCKI